MNTTAGFRIAAIALTALLAIALPVLAQGTTGSITGTVKDVQGGVVPGAAVTLMNEAQGTRSTPVVTSTTGDFVFANVSQGTYTIEIEMPSFKTLKRSAVSVSAGERVALGALVLEVGGTSEVVDVKGESPLIQATTGDRSFTVTTDAVENLPIASRSFTALATLAPGVSGTTRLGGGGTTFIMLDGISAVDTGSNGSPLLQMNVESIAEVKMLTSNYQAEYGRTSGLQMTAVTKSGTNRFRGSVYDVERNSDWNSNSKVNKVNGDPKPISKERDWGFSIGGPVGRPGHPNKLFFFYAQEFEPRTSGNSVVRFRMPTALERKGDFSQTTDNNGNPYPYIKDPNLSGTCAAGNTTACFNDGGVVGRIPASRLYQVGLNVLNQYPLPNIANVPAGQSYNFELNRPTESILSWQPAIRVDYQPKQNLRASFKYSGWQQRNQVINGSLPGFNDTKMQHPLVFSWATTVNYTLSPTMFIEATYGRSQDELAGCPLAQQSTGPLFCTSAVPMGPNSDRRSVGLENLPVLFPDANLINPNYYAYKAFNMVHPQFWDGTRTWLPPVFAWGSRVTNAPPTIGITSYLNTNVTQDVAISVTKVRGAHTIKSGFYNGHALKSSNTQRGSTAFPGAPFGNLSFAQDTVGTNPYDTSFGFANAAIGTFSSFLQSTSFVETKAIYNNTEAYIQDNWKVNRRLTLDYGVRFVHQQPQHDIMGQASNFFPEKWTLGTAPLLYQPGCADGVYPCSGTNRQAMNPNGQFLGPNSTLAIGALVPNTGNPTNGLIRQGQGIADTNFVWPALAISPRLGVAYDPTGRQRFVIRGAAGLLYDRPDASTTTPAAGNPPTARNITVRYGQLQSLNTGGLTTETPPALGGLWEYDSGALPTSAQWNVGAQMMLPWAVSLDVSYVGQHSWHEGTTVNLNAVDFGAAFQKQNQDPTLPASSTPGATALAQDLLRGMPGYSTISMNQQSGWRTYHSIQVSFQRRFRNGVSFGFNDTMGLSQTASSAPRLQHLSDGSFFIRDDQAQADDLLGTVRPQTHIMKANFVWDLPDLKSAEPVWRAVGLVVNDWQLSGIWSAATGSNYTVGFGYQSGGSNINLTGSPDYAARIRIVGDPGAGCSSDIYRQFNTAAFQGPLTQSVGLESGNDYLRGCFSSVLDLAIARNIRLPKGRTIQLRVDMFNVPDAAGITGRNSTINLTNPTDPVTANNLPFDANGNLIDARSRPRGAGFGVVNNYQAPRTVQALVRFSF